MRRGLVALGAIAVIGLYLAGRLDHLLYNVGLNYTTCAKNGFGAVFCGGELDDYRARIQGVQRAVQAALPQTPTTSTPSTPASTTGAVTLQRLPASTQAQATITVTHQCATGAICVWFGQASQYAGGTPCPSAFDASHSIWTGGIQQAPGTVHATVAFQPVAGSSVEVCAYAHDGDGNDQLATPSA